ncbi:aldehyde reductase II [Aspergillus lucknowensis]|uniref:NAD-dependent epimerase/dehydratase domain-containing protein n=1 Tax=Aspergillus lucknowensis TaxID=176173 RepID=A0ABR4LDM7_9EURO
MSDLKIHNPVVPRGSRILVTGANGFIASHVVDQLLGAGWDVRGTVRDKSRTEWLNALFDEKYGPGRFETVQVPDLSLPDAFEDAVKGVSGIVHVASILTFDSNPNAVIPPLLAGTLGLLRSAAKEPGVKRFVLTSSSWSASLPSIGKKITLAEDTYNEAAVEAAYAPPPYEPQRGAAVYAASKVKVEQAITQWVEENSPRFEVNFVLPSANFGPVLHKDHPGSMPWQWPVAVYHGKVAEVSVPSQNWIDVQDAARLHVAALLLPEVRKHERIFGYAGIYTINGLLAILRKLYPERQFPDDIVDEAVDLTETPPAARAEELLRLLGRDGWTKLEDTVAGNLEGQV